MRKVVNFLLGSLQIQVIGAFPERFLNLCGTENFRFWNAEQKSPHVLTMTIPITSLKRAKEMSQRAMCDLKVIQGFGLPAFLYRFRSRYALVAGLVFAIFGAIVLSRFILVVDVTGNNALSDSVILTELESLGFGVGTYGPGVNCRELSNRALLRMRQLSFLSVNIQGIRAEVVVREADAPPEVESRWQAADIVARTDGVIVDVDALTGQVMVAEGDAVLEGEVLISSLETYESGDGTGTVLSSQQVRAEGEVWAMTNRELKVAAPLETVKKGADAQEQTVYSLKILKHLIKFYPNSSISSTTCDKIKHTYSLTLPNGTVLPLAWEVTRLQEHGLEAGEIDTASTQEFLSHQLDIRLAALIGETGQVISRKLSFTQENGVLTGCLKVSCLEQIGKTVPLDSQS